MSTRLLDIDKILRKLDNNVMNLFKKLKNLFISFEDTISKEHSCICCSKEILDGSFYQICQKCLNNIDIIGSRVCAKCGERLFDDILLCDICKDVDYNFNSSRSVCYYNEESSNIVKALKYGGRKYYAKHIAKMMTEDKTIFEQVDIITFVPMLNKKQKVRGYNQAEEIAREISKIVDLPVIDCLEKISENKNQAKLNKEERLKNLSGIICLCENVKDDLKGKYVLIIDDVFTTGATLSECAKILKASKPKQINALTFAKTKLNSIN